MISNEPFRIRTWPSFGIGFVDKQLGALKFDLWRKSVQVECMHCPDAELEGRMDG